jgi:hypothetical protein
MSGGRSNQRRNRQSLIGDFFAVECLSVQEQIEKGLHPEFQTRKDAVLAGKPLFSAIDGLNEVAATHRSLAKKKNTNKFPISVYLAPQLGDFTSTKQRQENKQDEKSRSAINEKRGL